MLINEGRRIAKQLGYEFSILVGHPSYYPRFGYSPAGRFGIKAPLELPDEVFMAINFMGKDTQLNDVVRFAPQFEL